MAMMASAAPGEAEAPSMYYITPPDPSWPAHEAEEWLEVFSDTTLPGITVHEVAPGHFSHGRAMRRAPTAIRQIAALRGLRRRLGALRGRTVRGGRVLRRRPEVRHRGLARGAGPGDQAGVRDRPAHGRLDGGRTAPAGSRPTRTCAARPRCPRRPGPPSTRATAATPGASWRSWHLREQARQAWGASFSLLRFHTAHARPGLSAARPARHGAAARLTAAGKVLTMTETGRPRLAVLPRAA